MLKTYKFSLSGVKNNSKKKISRTIKSRFSLVVISSNAENAKKEVLKTLKNMELKADKITLC